MRTQARTMKKILLASPAIVSFPSHKLPLTLRSPVDLGQVKLVLR